MVYRCCCRLLAAIPMVVLHAPFADREAITRLWTQRDDARFLSPQQKKIRELLTRETRPGEPVFVGCTSHRRVQANHIKIPYYLGLRPGASRYMQFDPGIITESDRQREVIADLDKSRPNVLLRFAGRASWDEPNASRKVGSPLLDHYLRARYSLVSTDAGMQIRRPKSGHLALHAR